MRLLPDQKRFREVLRLLVASYAGQLFFLVVLAVLIRFDSPATSLSFRDLTGVLLKVLLLLALQGVLLALFWGVLELLQPKAEKSGEKPRASHDDALPDEAPQERASPGKRPRPQLLDEVDDPYDRQPIARRSTDAGRSHRGKITETGQRAAPSPVGASSKRPPPTPVPSSGPQEETDTSPKDWTSDRHAPDQLKEAWTSYRTDGNGHFTPSGLQTWLEKAGLRGRVLERSDLPGDKVLAVDLGDAPGKIYLLPSFRVPARAVETWFLGESHGGHNARIQRLIEPAVANLTGGQLTVETKGQVA